MITYDEMQEILFLKSLSVEEVVKKIYGKFLDEGYYFSIMNGELKYVTTKSLEDTISFTSSLIRIKDDSSANQDKLQTAINKLCEEESCASLFVKLFNDIPDSLSRCLYIERTLFEWEIVFIMNKHSVTSCAEYYDALNFANEYLAEVLGKEFIEYEELKVE